MEIPYNKVPIKKTPEGVGRICICFDISDFYTFNTFRHGFAVILKKYTEENKDILFAGTVFCDYRNGPTVLYQDFTTPKIFAEWLFTINLIKNDPNTNERAYEKAFQLIPKFSWIKSEKNFMILIGARTARPPEWTSENIYWRKELEKIYQLKIKVDSINLFSKNSLFFRECAERTNGVYLPLNFINNLPEMVDKIIEYRAFGTTCNPNIFNDELNNNLRTLYFNTKPKSIKYDFQYIPARSAVSLRELLWQNDLKVPLEHIYYLPKKGEIIHSFKKIIYYDELQDIIVTKDHPCGVMYVNLPKLNTNIESGIIITND